jgi:hypothetical protein
VISPSEITGLMSAVSKHETTLRYEILQIVSAAENPMCCQEIYKKSINAPDTMTLSREVYQMTATAGLLEVAEKKTREGFREVAFYRLTELGKSQLAIPKQPQQTPAKVQPNTSISQENTMPNPSELRTTIFNKIVEHPGIKKDALIKHALSKHPEATEDQTKKTIENLMYSAKKIKAEGSKGDQSFHLATGTSTNTKPAVGKIVTGPEGAALAKTANKTNRPAAPPQADPKKKPRCTVTVVGHHGQAFDPEFRFAFGVRKDGGIAICKDGISVVLSHSEVQTILAHTNH